MYIDSGNGDGNVCHGSGSRAKYYQTTWIFLCDQSTKFAADYATVSDYSLCQYEINIRTWYACRGFIPSPSGSNSSASFSMGYVAIICFFVVIILGLLIYYIILGVKSKNWGKESMTPPFNLCKYFWVYTCVGCKVSFEWAKTKMNKDGAVGSDAIDDDVLVDTDE